MRSEHNLINLNDLKDKSHQSIMKFIQYNGGYNFSFDDCLALLEFINLVNEENMHGYNISYFIERIDKEFDIIRKDAKTIVNIEMKLSNRGDKLRQIKQNFQILSQYFPNHVLELYSYVKSGNKLFKYNSILMDFEDSNKEELNDSLSKITMCEKIDFELKSVYEEPDFFINDNYVLSTAQETVKNKIIESNDKINAIEGCGGTGKSLLALDMYKYYTKLGKNVLYLTPFAYQKIINEKLTSKINIKMMKEFDNKKFDVIIIDEAQRLKEDEILRVVNNCDKILFFYDTDQDIDGIEQFYSYINSNINKINKTTIKKIIRNDSTFDRFARKICRLKKSVAENKRFNEEKIKIYMLEEFFSRNLDLSEYHMIEPTKSKKGIDCTLLCKKRKCELLETVISNEIVHFEIGKEHRKVLVFLCEGYCIQNDEMVSILPICYGNSIKQLYTIISRAIEEVIIICDDIEIYNYIVDCKNALKNK